MKYRALAALLALVIVTGFFYAAFSSRDERGGQMEGQRPVATITSPQAGGLAVAALAPATNRNPAQMSTARLQALARCEQQPQHCSLDDSDPRAAHFDLGRRLTAELGNLAMLARAGARMDQINGGGIARLHVQNENGHVQEAALTLMTALPPDPANVEAILTALQRSHDAGIYTQAMGELLRYSDQAARSRVERTLIETLQTGGHFAGQAVAQEILPFLNSGNLARFQELAGQLPPGSTKRKLLEGTLLEFEQRQRGG